MTNKERASKPEKQTTDKGGEGNVTADRRYRETTRRFIESGKVGEAAEDATNMSEQEQREAEAAERKAKRKARE